MEESVTLGLTVLSGGGGGLSISGKFGFHSPLNQTLGL